MHAEGAGLEAEGLPHQAGELRIPGRGEGGGGGKARGLLGGGDAEVVSVPELSAHPVGAVTHDEGWDAGTGDLPGVPLARSGRQGGGLHERKFAGVGDRCGCHGCELPFAPSPIGSLLPLWARHSLTGGVGA